MTKKGAHTQIMNRTVFFLIFLIAMQSIATTSSGSVYSPQPNPQTKITEDPRSQNSSTLNMFDLETLANEILEGDPLKIFLFVHNNITYEPYFGLVKGPNGTLLEGGGNDFDQSSLLVALYNAIGISAHYLESTLTLTAEEAMNWVGVNTTTAAVNVFERNGIPTSPVNDPSNLSLITHIQVHNHSWINASVALDTWVCMDPSFKQYTYYRRLDLLEISGFNATEFVEGIMRGAEYSEEFPHWYATNLNETFIQQMCDEYFGNAYGYVMEHKELTLRDLWGGRAIVPATNYTHHPNITKTESYPSIPNNCCSHLRLLVPDDALGTYTPNSINYTVKTSEIYGKRVTLSFAPVAEEDWEYVINHDGIYNVPYTFYVHCTPILMIDGEIVDCVNQSSWHLGDSAKFEIRLYNPTGTGEWQRETITKYTTVGAYYAIVFNQGKVTPPLIMKHALALNATLTKWTSSNVSRDDLVGATLYTMGLYYLMSLDLFAAAHASSLNVTFQNLGTIPIVSLNLQTMISKVYFGGAGMDHVYHNYIVTSKFADSNDEVLFSSFFSTMASTCEGALFETFLNTPGISTEALLRTANARGIPIYAINQTNDQLLSMLELNLSTTLQTDLLWDLVGNPGATIIIPATYLHNTLLIVNASQHYTTTSSYKTWNGIGWKLIKTDGWSSEIIQGRLGELSSIAICGGHQSSNKSVGMSEPFWPLNAIDALAVLPGALDLLSFSTHVTEYVTTHVGTKEVREIVYFSSDVLDAIRLTRLGGQIISKVSLIDTLASDLVDIWFNERMYQTPTLQKIIDSFGTAGIHIACSSVLSSYLGGVLGSFIGTAIGGPVGTVVGGVVGSMIGGYLAGEISDYAKKGWHEIVRIGYRPAITLLRFGLTPLSLLTHFVETLFPSFIGKDPATCVHLTVMDPRGLHTGFNISTMALDIDAWNGIYQIPRALYNGVGNETHGDPQTIWIFNPIPGTYTLIHTGTTFKGNYSFHVALSSNNLNDHLVGNVTINPGDVKSSRFVVKSNRTDGTLYIELLPGINSVPALSSGSVNPLSGDNSTTFTYTVTYTDADNQVPQSIRVFIDENPQIMFKEDPEDIDFTDGCVYKCETVLGAGIHEYYFEASDGTNLVRLPLIGEYTGSRVNALINHVIVADGTVFHVTTESNSTISNFQFIQEEKKLMFNVTGPADTSGFCNITIPNQLLGGPFTIMVDGQTVSEVLSFDNGTHSWLHFAYLHSLRRIEIIGTKVVPEFPSAPILALVFVTLIAVALKKRIRKREEK